MSPLCWVVWTEQHGILTDMAGPHHIDDSGHARMVDVGDKDTTDRTAIARGVVQLSRSAYDALMNEDTPKGDVLAAARIAGIMGAKKTSELIPLCHQIGLSSVKVELVPDPQRAAIIISSAVRAKDQTGVEMEALTAVSVAGLTLYDMMKSFDRGMSIGSIELLEKTGGKSGTFSRSVRVVEKTEPNEPVEASPSDESEGDYASADEVRSTGPRALLYPSQDGDTGSPKPVSPPPVPSAESIARSTLVQVLDSGDPELVDLLSQDPITSAYMLGDLDLPYAEHCMWYGIKDDDLRAVLLLYNGLSVPAVLTKGDAMDVEALLHATRPALPRRFYCQIRPEHRKAIECDFEIQDEKNMIRMGCTRADFVADSDPSGVVALNHRDTAAIMSLYTHYPDNFFEPAMLGSGLYFGIREDDSLVSVAGLHVLSERYDVAAIGNIVTHADKRGTGLASKCIRRLLDELFQRVSHVTLNVETDNQAAIACYRKFGFTERYDFVEAWASAR